jgi:hypothetical protein
VKKLAASEKCTAEPPSTRWRAPKGVAMLSKATEPTTVRAIARKPIDGAPGALARPCAAKIR